MIVSPLTLLSRLTLKCTSGICGRKGGREKTVCLLFWKATFHSFFCIGSFCYDEFGLRRTSGEVRHAWTAIPSLLVLAHECISNQTCEGSDLSVPFPHPAVMAVMNWRLYIHFHGNKHHCPRATPGNLCKLCVPIISNPWEITECMQKQQDPPRRPPWLEQA